MHTSDERWTAIAARLRAEFEEQLDANVNAERRGAVEARLRAEFEDQLRASVKEAFKRERKQLLKRIEEELVRVFEENLDSAIDEELARLDEEAAACDPNAPRARAATMTAVPPVFDSAFSEELDEEAAA
jgi:hypothetical protein